jgi:hypothetical protein
MESAPCPGKSLVLDQSNSAVVFPLSLVQNFVAAEVMSQGISDGESTSAASKIRQLQRWNRPFRSPPIASVIHSMRNSPKKSACVTSNELLDELVNIPHFAVKKLPESSATGNG